MSKQTKNDIIDGMASEIADMAMNGASDEELKEAIDNSKDIIDSLKVDFRNLYFDPYTGQKFYSNIDFLKSVEDRINECVVPCNHGNISEDESIMYVSENEMTNVVYTMCGLNRLHIYPHETANGDLCGWPVYKEKWKELMCELDVDNFVAALTPIATFRAEFADNGWMDHICSNCGYTVNDDVHVQYDWNYCPNCGARFVKKPKSYISNASDIVNAITKKCF